MNVQSACALNTRYAIKCNAGFRLNYNNSSLNVDLVGGRGCMYHKTAHAPDACTT
jgi:hypothetical protein